MRIPITIPDTQPSLLQKLRDPNDQEAMARFFREYQPLIFHWCCRRGLADPRQATDRVLDKLQTILPNFDYKPDKRFRCFIASIVRSEVENVRRIENRTHGAVGSGDSGVLEQLQQHAACFLTEREKERAEKFERQCERMSRAMELVHAWCLARANGAKRWLAFWRRHVDGKWPRELAGELGMTETQISMEIHRVRRKLEAVYEELGGDD